MKLVKSFLVIALLIFLSVYQDSSSSAQTIESMYEELSSLEAQSAVQANEGADIQAQMDANKAQIEKASERIVSLQNDIDQNVLEINILEEDKEVKNEEIKELLVYYQRSSSENLEQEALLQSESIFESIQISNAVDKVTTKNDQKIEEFIILQNELDEKNIELEANIDSYEAEKEQLAIELADLNISLDDLTEEKLTVEDRAQDVKNLIAYYEGLGCGREEDVGACVERINKENEPEPEPETNPGNDNNGNNGNSGNNNSGGGSVTPPTGGSSGFLSPMEDGVITAWMGWYAPFGATWYHTGTDMVGKSSHTIYASASGTVAASSFSSVGGYYVVIHHVINGARYSTYYGHLAHQSSLSVGQSVDVNTVVGTMGNTGTSTGAHLHFEIQKGWYGIDFYMNRDGAVDVRNYLSYPDLYVYWSGRYR